MPIVHVTSVISADNLTTGGTLVIPAVQAGDMLLASFANKGANAAPTVVDDDVGGNSWVRVDGSGANGASVWFKRATANTSGKTITWSGMTTGTSGALSVYRGVKPEPGSFENVSVVNNQPSGTETIPGFTPSTDGSMICLFITHKGANINNNNYTATNPTALLERFDTNNTAQPCGVAHASELQTLRGNTGAISWTAINATHQVISFNLIQEGAGGITDGGISLWRRRRRQMRR